MTQLQPKLLDKDIREPLFDSLEETFGKVRLLEKNHLPKYKEKSKQFVQERLLEKVAPEVLWSQAYEELFERDYNTIAQRIADYRAASLKSAKSVKSRAAGKKTKKKTVRRKK